MTFLLTPLPYINLIIFLSPFSGMLSLCINTVHSLLTISSDEDDEDSHCRNMPSSGYSGLKLIAGDLEKMINVVESVSMKKDLGSDEIGFIRSSGGSVMEAMSFCTESLGFESCDQLEEDDEKHEGVIFGSSIARSRSILRRNRLENDRKTKEIKNKMFPPLLSSLNSDGEPRFVLKSVRENGRLMIKKVEVDRPEIESHRLHACRKNGRLTLHLRHPVPVKVKEEALPVQEQEEAEELAEAETEEKIEDRVSVEENKDEEERWKYVLAASGGGGGGGGESYRRCYDLTHHNFPLWNNHCVLTG